MAAQPRLELRIPADRPVYKKAPRGLAAISRAINTRLEEPPRTNEPDPSFYCDEEDTHISAAAADACVEQQHNRHSPWSYSRFRGVPVDCAAGVADRLKVIIRELCTRGALIHGGAVRDLLAGIIPGDIDIVIRPALRFQIITTLRRGYYVEVTRVPPGSFGVARYLIHMEPRPLYTDASMFIVDMRVVCDTPHPLHTTIPPDWDVCSLYVAAAPYASSTRDHIQTDWARIESRDTCADYDAIRKAFVTKRAKCLNMCDATNHHKCALAERLARETALEIAGFTDETVYQCDNYQCRRAPAAVVCLASETIIAQICAANVESYDRNVTNRLRFVATMVQNTAREAIFRANASADPPTYEWLLAVVKPECIIARVAPEIPRVMYTGGKMRTVSDAAHMISLASSGCITDTEKVLAIAKKYNKDAKDAVIRALEQLM